MYKNKEDQARCSHEHYIRNKEQMKKRAANFKKVANHRNQQYVLEYKKEHGCTRCPMKEPRCLDFHHLRDKICSIATAVNRAWSLKKLQSEMNKCILLCANCHRKETFAGTSGGRSAVS